VEKEKKAGESSRGVHQSKHDVGWLASNNSFEPQPCRLRLLPFFMLAAKNHCQFFNL